LQEWGLGSQMNGFPLDTIRPRTMHYETHQPVIDDLEARILTIRDSL
jgi:hypothetical protein